MGSESGTSVIVRIGALSSPMASLEASTELACGCGFRSASPASTITSASSTRIPIAGTSSSDPVDAARDRSGRGRLDDRRAGPRIPRKDPSPWRHDVRQPGDRQVLERDRASERDHDRDGDRGPQPVLDSPRVAAGAFRLAADREERADADREGEPDRVLAHDRREGRARGAHEVTARLARPPDPATPRTLDVPSGGVQTGPLEGRPVSQPRTPDPRQLRDRPVELGPGHGLPLDEHAHGRSTSSVVRHSSTYRGAQGVTIWRIAAPRAKRSKPSLISSSAIRPDMSRSTGSRPFR